MSSLKEFIHDTSQQKAEDGPFQLVTDRFLHVNLEGNLWLKSGSMIAYQGSIRFTREGFFEHGLGRFFKRVFIPEISRLSKAEGKGILYVADQGKKISLIRLSNESLIVNGHDLLAFEPTIRWNIRRTKNISAFIAGGFFQVELTGSGFVAITSYFDPLTLPVSEQEPLCTDPQATVAWSGTLAPSLRTDVSLRTFIGRPSGDSLQFFFRGNGWVVVQSTEENYLGREHKEKRK